MPEPRNTNTTMGKQLKQRRSPYWIAITLPVIGVVAGASFRLGFILANGTLQPPSTVTSAACQPDALLEEAQQRNLHLNKEVSVMADQTGTFLEVCAPSDPVPPSGWLVRAIATPMPLTHASMTENSVSLLTPLSKDFVRFKSLEHGNFVVYNVNTPPPFAQPLNKEASVSLDQVIAGMMALLQEQGYPTEAVSISLVDLTGECCEYAAYQDTQARYPASVAKLFWLVALYGQYEAGTPGLEQFLYPEDAELMSHYSSNGASSRIVDAITQTTSGAALEGADWEAWRRAREQLNDYFKAANYTNLNLIHKTFPIPDLALSERTGRDLQLAQGAFADPADNPEGRNYLTTLATARLLYEIDTGQAVSREYSDRIKAYLKHSTRPEDWQAAESNAIEDFFGEYLPADVELYTKLGYTFDDGRQEAAIIASADGKTRFILVVFANDPIYSQFGSKAFPEIARYAYEQLRSRSSLP